MLSYTDISPKNTDVALVLIPCLFPEAEASTEIPVFAMVCFYS
jgi:hypothetical protein